MQRLLFALALTTAIAAGAFVSSAGAMAVSTPAAVKAAIERANVVEEAAYACRRVRRCGPAGCVWRRVCRVW